MHLKIKLNFSSFVCSWEKERRTFYLGQFIFAMALKLLPSYAQMLFLLTLPSLNKRLKIIFEKESLWGFNSSIVNYSFGFN